MHLYSAYKIDHICNIKAGCGDIGIYRDAEIFLNCIYHTLDRRCDVAVALRINTVELAGHTACIVRDSKVTGYLENIELSVSDIELTYPHNVCKLFAFVKSNEKH